MSNNTSREREVLRIMTFSAYDLQMVRMQMGLRLTANFRNKLKRDLEQAKVDSVDTAEDEVDKNELSTEALKLIDELKESYRRLTDGVARNRKLPAQKGFSGDALITEFTELVLVDQYLQVERDEKAQFRQLEAVLEPIPVYRNWLRDQVGIGPAMAAVLLSYFDPYKAPRISNFWAYCGIDVVNTKVFVTNCDRDRAMLQSELVIGDPMAADGKTVEELEDADVVGLYTIVSRGRSRRAEHLIDREYKKADGSTATRKSVTYNPWLKSRLLGALATSFLRTKNCPARMYYDDYRQRIMHSAHRLKITSVVYKKAYKAIAEGKPFHVTEKIIGWKADGKSFVTQKCDEHVTDITQLWPPLRLHRAAMRYMIKQFLVWFWVEWRRAEGLPVTLTYAEEKLGIRHSGPTAFDGLGLRADERDDDQPSL